MFSQKITFCAVTGVRLDHMLCFSLIVTLVPLKVGALARLSELFTIGWPSWPNQYSGRYSSAWRSKVLTPLTSELLLNGKVQFDVAEGGSPTPAEPPLACMP